MCNKELGLRCVDKTRVKSLFIPFLYIVLILLFSLMSNSNIIKREKGKRNGKGIVWKNFLWRMEGISN